MDNIISSVLETQAGEIHHVRRKNKNTGPQVSLGQLSSYHVFGPSNVRSVAQWSQLIELAIIFLICPDVLHW